MIAILGYGVMVTLQILVLSFLVRIRVSQLPIGHLSVMRDAFLVSVFFSSQKLSLQPKAFLWQNVSGGGWGAKQKSPTILSLSTSIVGGLSVRYTYSYLFSASMALIFCLTSSRSLFSLSTLRFISSSRLLPFLLAALRKPRLFS